MWLDYFCHAAENVQLLFSMITKRRRKKKSRGYFFKLIFILAVIAVSIYFITAYIFRPPFILYKGFGISLPSRYSIHGIDVSRYQKNINWKQVKAMQDAGINLEFAYIKATEGAVNVDPLFHRNWVKAKEAGMARGAYHFFTANKEGKVQAKNFIQIVQLETGDLPPVLDVEKTYGRSPAVIQKEVAAWLNAVEEAYNVKPIIYTNVHFYNTYLAGKFDEYPLWVAHYFAGEKPRIERDWLMWQHSETGRVNGINATVDFNAFSGSWGDFEQMKIQ